MTFTKTSQKFGQWSDVRANTVYGLGFSSEVELNKVRRQRCDFSSANISFLAIPNLPLGPKGEYLLLSLFGWSSVWQVRIQLLYYIKITTCS